MKAFIRKIAAVVFSVVAIALAACSNPFAQNKEKSSFVITVGSGGTSRSALDYPPKGDPDAPAGAPDLKDLIFTATFTPVPSGTPKRFRAKGDQVIKGELEQGVYALKVEAEWGDALYAHGVAKDNPITIGGGTNTIRAEVFSVDDAAKPLISAKPQSAAYLVGATPTVLTVKAASIDGGDLTYQWFNNGTTDSTTGGTPIGGAVSASFTPPTTTQGKTYYYVEVTNTRVGNSRTVVCEPAAEIAVNYDAQTPVIGTQPAALTEISSGQTAALSIAASVTDGGTLSYQWYKSASGSNSGGTAITGADSDSYTTESSLPDGLHYYYCVVTNNNDAATGSKVATKTSSVAVVSVAFVYTDPPGTGTPADPFIVCNLETLQRVGKGTGAYAAWNLSASYKQIAPIALPSTLNWTPIGDGWIAFTGSYDGGGYIISGLTINSPTTDPQGLFGFIDGGTVINLGLVNCDIKGMYYVGGIAGAASNGLVENCYATGIISISGVDVCGSVGGIAGYSDGTVKNCYAAVNVSAGNHDWAIGGVVGENYGMVENCYATGNISVGSDSSAIGGVVGQNDGGTVKNCYATGDVSEGSVSYSIGGVVGINSGMVENCYATGIVSGGSASYSIGGIVGAGDVKNCVALNPNINGSYVGRVVASGYGTLADNYARSDMKKNGAAATWTSSASGADGESITQAEWGSESWWTGTAGFGSAWDCSGVSATRGPVLLNMPGETQAPGIK